MIELKPADSTVCSTASSMKGWLKAHTFSPATARAGPSSSIRAATLTCTSNSAAGYDLILTHAIETHVHADFVSGSGELSARGVRTIAGPGADLGFDHHEAKDGEAFKIGDVSFTTLHTPGHTPEHISVVAGQPGEPDRVLTGDTLFVGAVGRPDLLGGERARGLAGDLYTSLVDKLLALRDDVEVHPGHGAGSLCGTSIGSAPYSTIGQERLANPWLQYRSKDSFVRAVLADLPETPPYFAELKRLNQIGPPVLGLGQALPATPALSPEAAFDAVGTRRAPHRSPRARKRSPTGIPPARSTSGSARRSGTGRDGSFRSRRPLCC